MLRGLGGERYMQRGEIDMMVVERQIGGKAKVIAREEIKTRGAEKTRISGYSYGLTARS